MPDSCLSKSRPTGERAAEIAPSERNLLPSSLQPWLLGARMCPATRLTLGFSESPRRGPSGVSILKDNSSFGGVRAEMRGGGVAGCGPMHDEHEIRRYEPRLDVPPSQNRRNEPSIVRSTATKPDERTQGWEVWPKCSESTDNLIRRVVNQTRRTDPRSPSDNVWKHHEQSHTREYMHSAEGSTS